MLQMIDTFAGVGSFSLAAQWTNEIETIQFVEINAFCQKVLKKNFPGVSIHADIRNFDGKPFRGRCNILTGGFPCQDIAGVNRNAQGLSGSRSGLWHDLFRAICEIMPEWVVLENVSDLRQRGRLDAILGQLSSVGYDSQWHSLSACDYGAAHKRERVFVIAYPCNLPSVQADSVFHAVRSRRNTWPNALRGNWNTLPATDRQIPASVPIGMDDGIPNWMDRNRTMGNTVVPVIGYSILKSILASHKEILEYA